MLSKGNGSINNLKVIKRMMYEIKKRSDLLKDGYMKKINMVQQLHMLRIRTLSNFGGS